MIVINLVLGFPDKFFLARPDAILWGKLEGISKGLGSGGSYTRLVSDGIMEQSSLIFFLGGSCNQYY